MGFALAGGYAVQAHGILHRPGEGIDLFTASDRRGDFAAAVDAITAAYTDNGYAVEITQQFETFARLAVTDPEPRDFLDVDAAITSGRHTRHHLCELAEQADAGFDRRILADLFGMLDRYPDRRFAAYGADADHLAAYGTFCRLAPTTTQRASKTVSVIKAACGKPCESCGSCGKPCK